MTRRAVFVDRDGVLNELVPDPGTGRAESPLHTADVSLIDGAAAAIVRLRAAGYLVVGATNQPAAAKGQVSVDELLTVHEHVLGLLAQEGAVFDRFSVCLHHPDGVDPVLTGTCDCRKPAARMLTDAAHELAIDLARSWMVGDSDSDVAAGTAAGVRTILIENPGSAHRRSHPGAADATARDLATAAEAILGEDAG